jgi:protein-tyrosine kinase
VKSPTRTSHLAERHANQLKADALPEAALLLADTVHQDYDLNDAPPSRPANSPPPPPGASTLTITSEQLRSAGMVALKQRGQRMGEEFRLASHNVRQTFAKLAPGPGHNIVMVTSACPGEGKSFTALNLAGALSHSNDNPVLLVDGDIRERSLSKLLGCTETPAIFDTSLSPTHLARSLVIRTEFRNLSFLPIGGDQLEESGSSSRSTMTSTLLKLSDSYSDHLIVLDVSPSLANSDPSSFASIVGQIVLVVEAGKTRRREVESALDVLDACPNISLLLNRMAPSNRGVFGSYS